MEMQKAMSERYFQNSVVRRIAAGITYRLILWNAQQFHHM